MTVAMTGGTAKHVASGTPNYGDAPSPIRLYVYYKEKSQSVANNTTVLSLGMYFTTPSGWDIGSWSDYNGSYVGTATSGSNCKTFNGKVPTGTTGTYWLVENQDITVKHDDDGTKKVTIYWKWGVNSPWGGFVNPSGSFTIDLTTIPRASTIYSAWDTKLGSSCGVKWTPHSASFYYKLKFQLSDWSYTTNAIHPNTTVAYTYSDYKIPVEVASKIATSTGTMTVTLYTYSDSLCSKQVGSEDSKTFTVTVPQLLPEVTVTAEPFSSLPSAFDGLYIQGKTKVRATVTAKEQYGAKITKRWVSIEGKTYDQDDSNISEYLSKYGDLTITGYATDTRENTGSGDVLIKVLPYGKPLLLDVVVGRCDSSGNMKDNGSYLLIKAKRGYALVDGKNKCAIQYRYKLLSAPSYSSWETVLSKDATSDEVITAPLMGGNLSIRSTYEVQIRAIDDIGEYTTTTVKIPTDKVFCHRGRHSISYGGYIEEDNAFVITGEMKFKVKNEQWVSLGLSEEVSQSTVNYGRGPESTGCFYRVVNGNHVQVAFNCACNYAGTGVWINLNKIPEEYRPPRPIVSYCPASGRAIAQVLVNAAGNVYIDYIQRIASTGDVTSYSASWIDGYIDYYL